MQLMFLIILVAMVIFFGLKRSINFIIMLIALYLIFTLMFYSFPFLVLIGIYFIWRWNKSDSQNSDFFRTFRGFEDFNEFYEKSNNGQRSYYRENTNDFVKNSSKYYKILGLEENANEEEVKKAYKKLAKEYHPDLHHSKSDEEKIMYEKKFKEINDAYNSIIKNKKM